jgi:CO/xanthine dehydrogenase Mo-binding subunit
MNQITRMFPLRPSRRDLLRGAGALVVTVAAAPELGGALAQTAGAPASGAQTSGTKPPLRADQLDSWIAVKQDGGVLAFFGKMDMGQGVDVAIGQIVAEELDVAYARVTVVMGDSATSVNQGGASGSTGIQKGGIALRNAAAEARRVLLDLAAEKLGVGADRLTVADGVVAVAGAPDRKVSYGELIGGRYFNVPMTWNNAIGNDLVAAGRAKPKSADQYKIVGQSVPRSDVAGKVFGTAEFVTDIKLPGMMHGRTIRPPAAGTVPSAIDEGSIRDLAGVRVVHNKGFLAVVAEREWDAVRAAERLKVAWSDAPAPFPRQDELYDHLRRAPAAARKVERDTGNVETALAQGARLIEAEYEWPFQVHASMGPACALADVRADGVTVWTGSQKPHFVRDGVAKLLDLPPDKVRAIWVAGPGSYGRNDAGDAALDAAYLSRAVGRPVRLQGMRGEGHAWTPKGPASIHKVRAALDASGRVIAYDFLSRGFDRLEIQSNESNPRHSLSGQLMGLAPLPANVFGVPGERYAFANKRLAWDVVAPWLASGSPLRTSHLRDPLGPQIHFASESFIDEMAAAIGADPVEFRLRHLEAPRDRAVIQAAAERAGWQPRPSPRRDRSSDGVASGRGISYTERAGTIVAVVAEVEVDRRTGRVWGRKFTVAHDCGLIVNPDGLRRTIEGNVVQALSRTLHEEVTFERAAVTSVDWETYPILDATETPESIESVLINRPDVAPSGAGEPSTRTVPAAVANAVFDATGVRIRRAPLTPERVKAAFA